MPLHLAWSRGGRPEPCSSGFLGPRRVRAEGDLAHQNLHMEPKSGWPREAAAGPGWELGGRPAGGKAHCHQQPVVAGTERNWESAPHDPCAAASSPRPARLTPEPGSSEPAQCCSRGKGRGAPLCPALTYRVLKRTDARGSGLAGGSAGPGVAVPPDILTWNPTCHLVSTSFTYWLSSEPYEEQCLRVDLKMFCQNPPLQDQKEELFKQKTWEPGVQPGLRRGGRVGAGTWHLRDHPPHPCWPPLRSRRYGSLHAYSPKMDLKVPDAPFTAH